MPAIPVPKPKSVIDPDRPANTLLLAQVQHLQQAERRLPLNYRSKTYAHAIETEGEAADYIREITEAVHRAHEDWAKKRAKPKKKGLRTVASAARLSRPTGTGSKAKGKKGGKPGRKK